MPLLELIPPQPAIDRHNGPRYVASQRRCQEDRQRRQLLRLAVTAGRDLLRGVLLAVLGRVVAPDLLAHDAARRDAVDRDAVLTHLAREALGPGVHSGLGAERGVKAL